MEHQIHFGKKFYKDLKTGYWISTSAKKIRAHVWVWERHNGRRPKGFHVHHKDENKSNNDISNLEIIEAQKHMALHMSAPERKQQSSKLAEKIRPLTKAWHASEDGRRWHKEQGIEGWLKRKSFVGKCNQCSMEFSSKTYHQDFCSNKCKSAWRRKQGFDNIELICPVCKITFKRNKYGKQKTCGRTCGGLFKSKKY